MSKDAGNSEAILCSCAERPLHRVHSCRQRAWLVCKPCCRLHEHPPASTGAWQEAQQHILWGMRLYTSRPVPNDESEAEIWVAASTLVKLSIRHLAWSLSMHCCACAYIDCNRYRGEEGFRKAHVFMPVRGKSRQFASTKCWSWILINPSNSGVICIAGLPRPITARKAAAAKTSFWLCMPLKPANWMFQTSAKLLDRCQPLWWGKGKSDGYDETLISYSLRPWSFMKMHQTCIAAHEFNVGA